MRKLPDPRSIAEAALLFAWFCIDPAAGAGGGQVREDRFGSSSIPG
jgi:hypothetical protein